MSTLSDLLNARLPDDWTKPRLVEAMRGRLDRATVYKYLAGNHPENPHESVLQAFADALAGLTLVELRTAANQPAGIEEPWIPPVEANRLTMAQRRALEAFIKATVAAGDGLEQAPVEFEQQLSRPVPAAEPVPIGPLRQRSAGQQPVEPGSAGQRPAEQPLAEQRSAELSADEQAEVQRYLDQLYASGRGDLAERVAASLVINSASETASKSSKD